ncbi:MAG: PQQ-like beta-propeller repeat protein, partial [Phycisphaerae bacterium]|nr:PQQ-like beta-propeller repeat protein [Phycisphaerae bacterium]
MRRVLFLSLLAFLPLTISAKMVSAGNWPQFRGPGGRGVSDETELPSQWSETQNLKWKISLPGPGSSSPIVYGDRLFITCYSGYGTETASGSVNDLKRHLLCINPDTGLTLWSKTIPAANPEDPWRGYIREHGYASSTPICDEEHVYVFFGKTGALAFDMTGQEIWRKNLGTSSSNRGWGSGASPILCGDLLIVNASEESRTIYALDKFTGKEIWKVESDKTELTYNTPALVNLANDTQELVVSVPYEIWAFNPNTGECTWWATTELAGNISPSILAVEDVVYALGGYPRTASVAIRAGGKADVTKTHTLWTSQDSSYVPSPVEHDGYLYWVSDTGQATCIEAKTGKVIYKEKLTAKGSKSFYASVVLADGKLYAPSRTSGTFVLAAKPVFELISQNTFASDKTDFNGSPA